MEDYGELSFNEVETRFSQSEQHQVESRNERPRHTDYQIQELDAFYKECPRPDEGQKQALSSRLGLSMKQIKFWFQNKRTHTKTQLGRLENEVLKEERMLLIAENVLLEGSTANLICSSCSGATLQGGLSDEQRSLIAENIRLRGEIARTVASLTTRGFGQPFASPRLNLGIESGAFILISLCVDRALAAVDEFLKLANAGYPLWMTDPEGGRNILNEDAYLRDFPRFLGSRHRGFAYEATKETSLIVMNGSHLVDALMDPNQFVDIFSSLIANARVIEVISGGSGGTKNGALQVMEAEFQVLSPLVPTRQVTFLRFCMQQAENVWVVVDISVDANVSCRRLPSGCMIQDMGNGCSKVIWVEHTEYDESTVHPSCRSWVRSGMGFGAHRWLATLERQCESSAFLMSNKIAKADVSSVGRMEMSKLTQAMVRSFFSGICAPISSRWEVLLLNCLNDDVWIKLRRNSDRAGEPIGMVLSATNSVWMHESHDRLFQFLNSLRMRSQWDMLCGGEPINKLVCLQKGQEANNCISILRTVTDGSGSENHTQILQETWQDRSGALIVFSPLDVSSMNLVMNGGDSTNVTVLPSGFAILPNSNAGYSSGCLLTFSVQMLVSTSPSAELSGDLVSFIKYLISSTLGKIKDAMGRT